MANAIVPFNEKFEIAKMNEEKISAVLQNIEDNFNPWDLPIVKTPSGGVTVFQVVQPDGNISAVQEISGIILEMKPYKKMYLKRLNEGESGPPDCYSMDGRRGFGILREGQEPQRRSCAVCPMNQFGSDGRGKKCKEYRILFLLQEKGLLPLPVMVPPTSLKNLKAYMGALAMAGLPRSQVVTKITLQTQKNKDNLQYAQMVFSSDGVLSEEDYQKVRQVAKEMESFFKAFEPVFEEFGVESASAEDGVVGYEAGQVPEARIGEVEV